MYISCAVASLLDGIVYRGIVCRSVFIAGNVRSRTLLVEVGEFSDKRHYCLWFNKEWIAKMLYVLACVDLFQWDYGLPG